MKNIIINYQDLFGAIWFIGWLFTIGYLQLTFWKGVLAIVIWPYYIGLKFKNPLISNPTVSAPAATIQEQK